MELRRFFLCMVLLILAGCGRSRPAAPTPSPSPRAGATSQPTTVALSTQPVTRIPASTSAAPPTVAPTPIVIDRPADDADRMQVPAAGGAAQSAAPQGAINPFQAPGAAQGEDQNPLETLFPELSTAPGPTWLAEGVRVTYYIQSVGPAAGPDETTSYGAGLMQYDTVAVSAGATRASWKFYLDQGQGKVTPSGMGISRGIPGVGEYWVQPEVLRDAERAANDELTIVHMPATVSGETYEAVRFEYHPPDATYVWMYDAASGVLLFYRHAIGDQEDPYQSAQMIFLGRRTLSVPWHAASAPGWVETTSLQYQGEIAVLTLGSPTASFPYSIFAEPQGAVGRCVEYVVIEYTLGQISGRTDRVTGLAQLFNALWLPAEALRSLDRRMVLDDDPFTGAQVSSAPGDDGTIVLTESAPAFRTTLTYDGRTGQLVSLEQETTTGVVTTRVAMGLAN